MERSRLLKVKIGKHEIEVLNRITDAKVKGTTNLRSILDIIHAIAMVAGERWGCKRLPGNQEMRRKIENKSSWRKRSLYLSK